ncbi:Aste57867_24342 [Aphanomyces stellatus]|uniref:Aste57867_24342 protein n=1 Tax=Aphanomyces stellatus TaxID=120398 RepID=A0A485LQ38_9STRA|nr:hypothetical protein As57867_024267 [Aphanomyces stellatus]VFU00982.1 Aste57867_24342 [Aphanomyces stellatus]
MSTPAARVAESLRAETNAACADCAASITSSNAWASVTHGVFLCIQCAGCHRKLGVQVSRVKSVVMDTWTDDEAKAMKGNRAVNAILEKHGHAEMKASMGRADATREMFIRAKYEAKLFTSAKGQAPPPPGAVVRTASIVEVTKRYVNYFVVVGRGASLKQTVVNSIGPGDIQFQPVILDSYPDAHADAPLPTHIAQFAFPEGCALSATFREPTFFSFVLTNVSGVKLYACALKFDELLTPFEVMSLFVKETMPTWAHALSSGSKQTSVYAPKCLVVISHYPFFSSFRAFLQQIYRVSLSEGPLPLERYIANFVSEIPLPPQGRVQVQLTLPERTMLLSRPPKNLLPHADFTFRPLFQMLDLANVLTVFACLLLEQKAKCTYMLWGISVAHSVSIALLSLLFPLYWQGAYIPILPSSLLDVIDAPVPFLVGVHSKYLASPSRASDVFFVDLDHNRVIPPSNELGQETVLPKLPDREAMKLRAKLQECANVFDPFASEIAKSDLAYDNEEYLKPLDDIVGGGMTVPMPGLERKSSGLTLDRKSTLSFQTLKMLVPSQSASGLSERSASMASTSSPTAGGHNVHFNPDDIRHAFLRFFVSVCKRYATYLNPKAAHEATAPLFDTTGFLRDNSDATSRPFLTVMIASQMFQRFCEDRLVQPPLPEVLFFDASINQKLNRSLSLGKKKYDVAFLEDKCDAIRETFVAPPPSTLGLPDNGTTYKYRGFPRLKRHLFGTIRKPRELYTSREQQRHVAPVDIHQQIYQLSTCVVMESGASWDATRKLVLRLQALYRMHRVRTAYRAKLAALYRIQRFVGSHLKRRAMQQKYQRFRRAVVALQSCHRAKSQRVEYKRTVVALRKIQGAAKTFVYATRYHRLRRGVLRLQAWVRRLRVRQSYLAQKKSVVRVQSHVRGKLTRLRSLEWRKSYLTELQAHMFALWTQAAIPLVYRSKFWMMYARPDFLCLGVHLEEIARLNSILGIKENAGHGASTTIVPLPHPEDMMDTALTRKGRKRRQKILKTSHTSREIASVRLEEELLHLYDQLKFHTNDSILQSFYRALEIPQGGKKKKRKMLEMLWTSFESAQTSAEIVLAIGGPMTQHTVAAAGAMETKQHSRICSDLVYTVNAAMASLHKTKPRQPHKPAAKKAPPPPTQEKEELMRAMVYQNHCLEIQLAEAQRELHKCQQALAAAVKNGPETCTQANDVADVPRVSHSRKSSLLRGAESSYQLLP